MLAVIKCNESEPTYDVSSTTIRVDDGGDFNLEAFTVQNLREKSVN
jgi:hypothetical protein